MIYVYVALALLSLSTRTVSQNQAVDSINGFSVEFLTDILSNQHGNVILSPLSVGTLLAMLEVGAQGNSKQELRQVLKYPSQSLNSGQDSYRGIIHEIINMHQKSKTILEFGSRIYISHDILRLNPRYTESIENNYFADVRKLDFRQTNLATQIINEWVNSVTRGKITSIVPPGAISQDTRLVLANAIYFRGVWEKKFNVNSTTKEKFITDPNVSGKGVNSPDPKSIKLVPMMYQVGTFLAGTDSQMRAKWVHLPFENGDFSMVFVLPTDDNGINDLSKRLTKENIAQIIQTKSTKSVTLHVPRFKISTDLSLIDSLKRLGVKDIFGPGSDLSGMLARAQDHLYVDQVFHKAEIEVNEEGSTAAAATGVLVNTLSLFHAEELYFNANHPFLVFIIKNNSGYPLFMGRVVEP